MDVFTIHYSGSTPDSELMEITDLDDNDLSSDQFTLLNMPGMLYPEILLQISIIDN